MTKKCKFPYFPSGEFPLQSTPSVGDATVRQTVNIPQVLAVINMNFLKAALNDSGCEEQKNFHSELYGDLTFRVQRRVLDSATAPLPSPDKEE